MGLRVHGDRDLDELRDLGLEGTDLLDFSVNLNPLGPMPAVLRATRGSDPVAYPDASGTPTREHVARWLEDDASRVIVAGGAAALLWDVVRTTLRPDETLMVLGPTFSEAAAAARAVGAEVSEWCPKAAERVNLSEASAAAAQLKPALVYLCNPNNPTGQLHTWCDVVAFAEAVQAPIIVDEAFLTFSAGHVSIRERAPRNVLRVRSLTKDHAIAGVRAAYAVGDSAWVSAIEANRPPWSTSAPSLAAIRAACTAAGETYVAGSRARVLAWRDSLCTALGAAGVATVPSDTLFVLAAAPEGAAPLRARLLRDHHIVVRDCSSFGLSHHVRLCARSPEDVQLLAAAWAGR